MHRLTKWLKIWRWLALLVLPSELLSQTLTLDEANDLARKNYPLIRQQELIRKTADLHISNLAKGYLPQLSLNGQVSYQSDVTRVDVPIPGIKIEAPEKDQYKLTADVNQLIYDGGVTRQQKEMQLLNAAVEGQQVEVDLYKLKERINQVYLGILYLDEQIRQVELIRQDLQTGLKKIQAQVKNGVAFRSNANILRAELIKTAQRRIELVSTRNTMIETLSLFLRTPLSRETVFQKPSVRASSDTLISRPEIKLFSDQSALLGQQNKLIRARNLPRTSLFFQGGYGRPGLNMLKNEFDLFYITGVRLNWSLSGLYTKRNDKQLVSVSRQIVDVKKETFLLNTSADIRKQQNEILKLQQLIGTDKEIIDLRGSVTMAAKAQLENGVITASDYLREVNAEDQARQTLIAHEIQLLQAQIGYQTLLGN